MEPLGEIVDAERRLLASAPKALVERPLSRSRRTLYRRPRNDAGLSEGRSEKVPRTEHEQVRTPLPAEIRLSRTEVHALARLGREITLQRTDAPLSDEATPEELAEREQKKREEQARREAAEEELREEITERLQSAYEKGVAAATDRDAQRAYQARSLVLLLVVLAVVTMPILAILIELDPEVFGTYMAPVTGIAGTVVGYWFGTVERRRDQEQNK
jgi:hypothetical protein